MSSTEPKNTTAATVQQQPPALQRHDSTGSSSNKNNNNNVDARFSCNICFDSVVEPVVTQCGHLYCWPCLYRWLEPGMYPEERASLGLTVSMTMSMGGNSLSFDNTRRVCPVCKSPCSLPSLVPIYVRSTNEPSPVNRSNHINQTIRGLRSDNGSTERHETTQTVHPAREESRQQQQEEEEQQQSSSTTTAEEQQQQQQPLEDSILDTNLGLRQRHSRAVDATATTSLSTSNDSNQVPSRPAASSPQHPTNRHNTPSRNNQQHSTVNNNNWMSMSPNVRHGSLTHGILMSFHQAAMHVQNENNPNNNNGDPLSQGQQTIPSLHSIRDGSYEGNLQQQQQQQPIDVNSETTQYLSRLLIMLTSFVILCLLLL
ncbi:zinc-ring finger domain containing protein [Nitzschia inconspicua]|uniref:RING-type E3 ubiquitin transferase n=1 Tax=Nitzschia inconspicua TaxID=303405 RepID=A0A9K3PCM6_9STRA|nr:zinc-ring finger domain containing protein [Nitzschia inconspicua]